MAIELTKKDIAELSAIVQQNVEAELQGDKLQRMQAFGKEDGTIDTNGVLAFALSEAKLYATMFTTQLLNYFSYLHVLVKKLMQYSYFMIIIHPIQNYFIIYPA